MKDALRALIEGRDLDAAAMEAAIGTMMDGGATPAQIGAFLAGLAAKGETVDELVAAVRAMRARGVRVRAPGPLTALPRSDADQPTSLTAIHWIELILGRYWFRHWVFPPHYSLNRLGLLQREENRKQTDQTILFSTGGTLNVCTTQ